MLAVLTQCNPLQSRYSSQSYDIEGPFNNAGKSLLSLGKGFVWRSTRIPNMYVSLFKQSDVDGRDTGKSGPLDWDRLGPAAPSSPSGPGAVPGLRLGARVHHQRFEKPDELFVAQLLDGLRFCCFGWVFFSLNRSCHGLRFEVQRVLAPHTGFACGNRVTARFLSPDLGAVG